MKIHFVTSNKNKVHEVEAILGLPLVSTPLDIPEIQSLDMEAIVRDKVTYAFSRVKEPVFVDDAGLFVKAWKGFPGPFIKYLIGAGEGNTLLLRMMQAESDRNITARAAIAFHDGKKIYTFVGEVHGVLAEKPKGNEGWGFDPLFIPNGSKKTFGEMSRDEKNALSHRYIALKKFKEFLK